MLEDAVGEDIFQNGVTAYLKANEFGNAVTQDLWDEIQEIYGDTLDVTQFMSTWTVQMGFPVVNVATVGEEYVLTQKRFLTDPDTENSEDK